MRIHYSFSYTESVVPPRCRKPRRVLFDDGVISADIPEATGEDAPVAIIAKSADHPNGARGEFRWFNKKLWASHHVAEAARVSYTQPLLIIPTPEATSVPTPWRSESHLSRAEVAERIKRECEDWLIVDGQLYIAAYEPFYMVMTFGLGHDHGGTSLTVQTGNVAHQAGASIFNLMQLSDAQARTRAVAEARHDVRKVNVEPDCVFEVLIPEAIQIPGKPLKSSDRVEQIKQSLAIQGFEAAPGAGYGEHAMSSGPFERYIVVFNDGACGDDHIEIQILKASGVRDAAGNWSNGRQVHSTIRPQAHLTPAQVASNVVDQVMRANTV